MSRLVPTLAKRVMSAGSRKSSSERFNIFLITDSVLMPVPLAFSESHKKAANEIAVIRFSGTPSLNA